MASGTPYFSGYPADYTFTEAIMSKHVVIWAWV